VISTTSFVVDWLERTKEPRVYQVFDSVCNLINEFGEIISLVSKQIGSGPFSIIVDNPMESFQAFLGGKTRISIIPGGLKLGEFILGTTDIPKWQSKIDVGKINIIFLKEIISDSFLEGLKPVISSTSLFSTLDYSIFTDFTEGQININSRFKNRAKTFGRKLCEGILDDNNDLICTGTRGLAGLGGGLTPAGDDFILGVMFANIMMFNENKSKRINSEIVIEASPLTTTLSISWLISAAKGEFDMKWHDLFEAIKKQEIHHVYLGMKEIFTHGSTSGSDAIAGFISLLYFYFNHPNYSNN
jgi:hypothetical protein